MICRYCRGKKGLNADWLCEECATMQAGWAKLIQIGREVTDAVSHPAQEPEASRVS